MSLCMLLFILLLLVPQVSALLLARTPQSTAKIDVVENDLKQIFPCMWTHLGEPRALEAGAGPFGLSAIFVVHHPKLTSRREKLDAAFRDAGIDPEGPGVHWVTGFNQSSIDGDPALRKCFFSKDAYPPAANANHDQNSHWEHGIEWNDWVSSGQKYTVTMKHIWALWQVAGTGTGYALILEDDSSILHPDFGDLVSRSLADLRSGTSRHDLIQTVGFDQNHPIDDSKPDSSSWWRPRKWLCENAPNPKCNEEAPLCDAKSVEEAFAWNPSAYEEATGTRLTKSSIMSSTIIPSFLTTGEMQTKKLCGNAECVGRFEMAGYLISAQGARRILKNRDPVDPELSPKRQEDMTEQEWNALGFPELSYAHPSWLLQNNNEFQQESFEGGLRREKKLDVECCCDLRPERYNDEDEG